MQDQGYQGQNTWQFTAQMSPWSRNAGVASINNLPGSSITYSGPSFAKNIVPGAAPITLLARPQGTLPKADVLQSLTHVQLQLGNQEEPKAGHYQATMTYTLTQSLE
ncbi:hypothetical protein EQ500_02570 [Lactobacillus sp. XV13L]|nr:hypothetical protein [Lactobacillus sp. XV13L]